MSRAPAIVAFLVAVALLVPAVAVASPQPTPVCGACGSGLAGPDADVPALDDLRVSRSRATVRIHPDGSATWRVTNRLANASAAAYLRTHPDERERLVRDALSYSTVEDPFRNLSTAMDGRTLVIRFADPSAARRLPGDVLVVEYLHSRGYDSWPVLTADRLAVVGPEGTTVTNDPPGARVSGRTAVWRGNASVPLYEAPRVGSDAYVAYADGGPTAGIRTAVALAVATAPIVVEVTATTLLPPLVLAAVLLGGLALGGRRLLASDRLPARRSVAAGVAGLGALAVVVGALGGRVPALDAPRSVAGLGLVYLFVGGLVYRRGATPSREFLATGVAALAVVWLWLAATLPGEYVTRSEAVRRGLEAVARLFPFVLLPALGMTAAAGNRRRTALAALVVAGGFLVGELSVVPPTQRPFGLVIVFLVAYAVALVVAGAPLFLLGGMARPDESSVAGPDADRTAARADDAD
ncbi:MAG: hypothetical protein ABEH78_08420 [Haloferacaceae archaeon]